MVYVIFLTESTIGHIFTELDHVLGFIKTGKRHHRIEMWNKGQKRAMHW
jgi:hypothetical protein